MELPKIAIALFLALIVCVSAASAACTAGKCTCNCKACQSDSCTCRACTDSCPLTKCSGGSSTSGNSCSGSSCSSCSSSGCSSGSCSNSACSTNTPTCSAGSCSIKTYKAVISPAGTITYKLCSNNICNIGGNGKVLTLTNYDNAKNPTYAQLLAFLKADKTDQARYTSSYVCSDFARTLHNNAEKSGIKCAWIGCDFTRGTGHAFNRVDTTDKGTIYIDCTGVPRGSTWQDKQLNVRVGYPLTGKYLFRSGSIGSMGVVKKLITFW